MAKTSNSQEIDGFKAELKKQRPIDIVYARVLSAVPTLFSSDVDYFKWRQVVASHLETEASDILVLGSQLLGFSLSPHKSLQPKRKDSDVDIAIVSSFHFDVAWHALRQQEGSITNDRETQRSIDMHRDGLIYSGIVALDLVISLVPFGQNWLAAKTAIQKERATRDLEISFRIYRDRRALVAKLETNIAELARKA